MGISWTIERDGWDGDYSQRVRVTGTFSGDYRAGGESIAAADADLQRIEEVRILRPLSDSGYVVTYNHTTNNVRLYGREGERLVLTEIPDGIDVTGERVHLEVLGSA